MPNDLALDRCIDLVGNLLYVGNSPGGLFIFDVIDPVNPVELGSWYSSFRIDDFFISGDLAYLARWQAGMTILNISDPSTPTLVSEFIHLQKSVGAVEVVGNYAYLGLYAGAGLQIVDVTDPSQPFVLGGMDTAGVCLGLTAGPGFLYLADQANGLVVAWYHCGDPVPVFISNFTIEQYDTNVRINWQIRADFLLEEFRLFARGDGITLDIPIQADNDGRFSGSLNQRRQGSPARSSSSWNTETMAITGPKSTRNRSP